MSLHRTRADWPIVAAAFLVTLLAAVLLAAGPIYSSGASEAGLHRAVADAPVEDASIAVSVYDTAARAPALDAQVKTELQRVIAPLGGSIVRDWRASATLALPGPPVGEVGDQAILGFLDGLPDHAALVDGDWPAAASSPSGPIQVVVVDTVAQQLRLAVGDELSLVAHSADQPQEVSARLVGVFAIDSVADPYWNADAQLVAGIEQSGGHHYFGPFLTTPADLLAHAGAASVHMQWRTFPDFERLTVDDVGPLRSRLQALPGRLQTATGEALYVSTGLLSILGDAERSLLVSRTGVLLLIAQLAILAAYAIVLTASLLVDHRRIDTALLRSRGAGPPQVALLALAEGLLLAIPAVIAAPWLAVAAVRLLNVVGPLADAGLHIEPRVALDSYVAAGAAGIVCVGLLVLPAVLAARRFAAEQGGLSRQETRPFGQRMGLDIALLAVTGIALWQLRLYGAPLTRSVKGSLGLDPLLVAAPAIGLLAGGVLALRILPLLAQAIEAAVSRRRDLVASLGSWQLARRPLRYTRSALLLMLALSMGVFAVSYAATWSTSQHDQAAYQSGADVRVVPDTTTGAMPAWSLPGAYAGLASFGELSPVERLPDGVSFAAAGSADLLALNADRSDVVLFRADDSATPLAAMMATLRNGRLEPHLAALPEDTDYLRIVPRIELGSSDIRVSASAIVRDGHGLFYRVDSSLVAMNGATTALVVRLEPAAGSGADGVTKPGRRLDGPVELAGLGIEVWLPGETVREEGVIGVAEVSAAADPAGPWSEVPLPSVGDWRAKMAAGQQVLDAVPASQMRGTAVELGGNGPQGVIYGNGGLGVSARLSFLPDSIASWDDAVPAIANRAFLAGTGSAKGDTISATVAGALRRFVITGVVDTFPTTDPEVPLLVLDEPTLGLLRLQGIGLAASPDEWWIKAKDGDTTALSSALRGSPFHSSEVVSVVDRTRSLSTDPVALGIIGALALGFVATGLFAVVGLTVSAAVSARQRRTEFALLRALGLSGRQLSGSLWLENGSLVLVSLLAGTSLGLVIAWLVLPFVTVTQRASAPVPPVIVHVPWDRILLLDVISAVALGVAVVVIGGVLRRLGVGSILRMGED